jgi:hypothetical protein
MNKIARLCTRDRFSSFAPANFTDARENVRDRLLFPVMMNACPGPWFHLEQPAPDGGRDTERRRNRGTALGARRLRCCPIELRRADDVDCSRRAHGVPHQFGWLFNRGVRQRLTGQPLNWRLVVGVELGRTSLPTRGSFLQCLPRLARQRFRTGRLICPAVLRPDFD